MVGLLPVAGLMHGARAHAAPRLSAVRARLVKPLDARSQAGDSFYVDTMALWKGGNCQVRANTMVEGQIAGWHRRKDGANREELRVRFEPVLCYASETLRVTPVLVALRGPMKRLDDAGLGAAERKQAMMSTMANRAVQQPHTSGGAKGAADNAGRAEESAENRSIAGIDQEEMPDTSAFETGEVRNIRGVRMALPVNGSDAATMLFSSHGIELPPDTQFFLTFLPASDTHESASVEKSPRTDEPSGATKVTATETVEQQTVALRAAREAESASAANQQKLCSAGCLELNTAPAVSSGPASWSLSLAELGLRPRLGQVRVDFDDDASVHFLGNEELLVTFNTHSLTPRSADAGPRPRRVRAVLVSLKDGHILQMQEWSVFDDRQYTWDLGDGRVLAHVGHELLILNGHGGSGLMIENRYQLAGPVLFARVAPPGSASDGLIAVATIHEKHTPEGHQKLSAFLGPDRTVDEDYDLTMLNSRLEAIGTKRMDARPDPVALLPSGMVSAERVSGQKWALQQLGWDGKSAKLAELRSACNIEVAALPAKLLFAKTCDAEQGSSFYWILNSRGALILSGHAPGTELVQQAASNAAGDVVAVASTESNEPIDLRVGARVSDFRSLTLSAYRVSDGKKVLSVRTAQGSALRQTFALSPSGNSMAVLAGSTLQAYSIGERDHATMAIDAQSR